jgi:hypothetical protein
LRQRSSRSRTAGENPTSVTIRGFEHAPWPPFARTYHWHVRQHRDCTALVLAPREMPVLQSLPHPIDAQDSRMNSRQAPSLSVMPIQSQHLAPILRYGLDDRQSKRVTTRSLLCFSMNRPNRVSHHDLLTVRTANSSQDVRLYMGKGKLLIRFVAPQVQCTTASIRQNGKEIAIHDRATSGDHTNRTRQHG